MKCTAGVSAGEGLEAIHELAATAPVAGRTDTRGDHDPVRIVWEDLGNDRIDKKA